MENGSYNDYLDVAPAIELADCLSGVEASKTTVTLDGNPVQQDEVIPSLIRRRIKDSNLKLEMKNIGRVTKTDVAIMYIQGIADHKVVDEVRCRLERIDIDGILESGNIEELIQDATYTPFPTIYNTERPDSAAAGLLEGRIAILVDGTPFVLLVPVLFTQFLQAPEDYYHCFDFGLIRMLRFFSFCVAMLAPAVYISISTFHQSFIPSQLLISLAAQREGIPFPAFVEALMMELTFKFLREAGVRMPRTTGQAISIVGALVLGQSDCSSTLICVPGETLKIVQSGDKLARSAAMQSIAYNCTKIPPVAGD